MREMRRRCDEERDYHSLLYIEFWDLHVGFRCSIVFIHGEVFPKILPPLG